MTTARWSAGRLVGAGEERTLARLRALCSDLIDPAIAAITTASSSAPAAATSSRPQRQGEDWRSGRSLQRS